MLLRSAFTPACENHHHASRDRNVKRFRGGLVFEAHRRVYHSTLGSRVIKKKSRETRSRPGAVSGAPGHSDATRAQTAWPMNASGRRARI